MKSILVPTRSQRRTMLLLVALVAICYQLGTPDAGAFPVLQGQPGLRNHGSFFTTTELQDGRILVCGGALGVQPDWRPVRICDVYDPATDEWAPVADLLKPTGNHTANLLPDGRVLVVGGFSKAWRFAEIYDPATDRWTKVPRPKGGREDHTATLLDDGTVLIVGGYNNPTYQVFDPATDTWSTAKQPLKKVIAPAEGTAIKLLDGRVLVAGGWDFAINDYRKVCILYDRRTDTWTKTGSQRFPSSRYSETYTLLENGEVLLVYGNGTKEIWNPESGEWRIVEPNVQ